VAPAASGSLITKIWKGLKELKLVGLLNELNTRVYGAQAEGCSPIAQAWREGRDYITGNGYKTLEVLEGHLKETIRIKPTLSDE
jgi:threonine synthase